MIRAVIRADASGLVIDDDDAVCHLVTALMTAMGFKNTWSARDGSEGLRIAAEKHPDIVVCDVDMSPVDGVMFVSGLRGALDADLARTPIIIFSGHPNIDIVEKLKNLGVHDFLAKPFTTNLFAMRINEALGRRMSRYEMDRQVMKWDFEAGAYKT